MGRQALRALERTPKNHAESVPASASMATPRKHAPICVRHGTPCTMKGAREAKRIVEDIAQHLAKYPPLGSVDEILRRFLEEMRTAS